jgi:hypothetical protein
MLRISSSTLYAALFAEKDELLDAIKRCMDVANYNMAESHLARVKELHPVLEAMETSNGNYDVDYELVPIKHMKAEAPGRPLTEHEAMLLSKVVKPIPGAPHMPVSSVPAAIPRDPVIEGKAAPAPFQEREEAAGSAEAKASVSVRPCPPPFSPNRGPRED